MTDESGHGPDSVVCPGCALTLPADEAAIYDGYINASPECWAVFNRVLATEYSDGTLFHEVHQLTVDSYAVQHAGGRHPDKSIFIHLAELHLVLEQGVPPMDAPRLLQRLAGRFRRWPHFRPPERRGELTVADVAACDGASAHAAVVRAWARQVWAAWEPCHREVAVLVADGLD